jgi:hypothetical protein
MPAVIARERIGRPRLSRQQGHRSGGAIGKPKQCSPMYRSAERLAGMTQPAQIPPFLALHRHLTAPADEASYPRDRAAGVFDARHRPASAVAHEDAASCARWSSRLGCRASGASTPGQGHRHGPS